MLYTGQRNGAAEALGQGLVDHVVPADELLHKCKSIAAAICNDAALAVEKVWQSVCRGLDLPLADGERQEAALFDFLRSTDNIKEGAQAFSEKLAPIWRGS